jgi:hypothetical protein
VRRRGEVAILDMGASLDVNAGRYLHCTKQAPSLPGRSKRAEVEGQAIYLDGEAALLSCTGAATLSRTATADPCLLVLRRGRDVRRAARAFFALSQLNYSSPSKAQRYAHPIRETDSRLQQRMAEDMRGVK